MKKLIIALLLSIVNYQLLIAQIGTWRNYLAYHDVQQIQAASGNDIFVLASNGLYQYNKVDQSIVTYDKVNGLNDTYITHIGWCQSAKRLVVVYENSNIDLVETNGNITNINSIYTKIITGDKTIYDVTISGQYAYLACGFGVVKLNVKQAEISESYMLGFPVSSVCIDGPNIYAQSATGVWMAALSNNLIDKSNWKQTSVYPSFVKDNSDYEQNIGIVSTLSPGGPKNNYFYFIRNHQNNIYTCGGHYDPLVDLQRPGTIQVLKGNDWTIFEDRIDTITKHQYVNIDCVDIDPHDDNHVFASGRTGLYEFQNGKFVREYNYYNSELSSTFTDNKDYVIVNTIKFDDKGRLWMIQSLNSTNKLLALNSDGTWTKKDYNLFNDMIGNGRSLIFDSKGYLWFTNDHYDMPAVFRYDTETNEEWKYTSFINQDNTNISLTGIRCVVEDKEGNMWIGTNSGPIMLEPLQVESSNPVFTQVKVPRNDGTNYADYLLSNIDILSISIDGANRKWFGTNGNGVYLISADNMEQIQHFTSDNSPLLSDIVQSIAINSSTGEVFFGTDKGLCSYISDATETNTEMNKDNVWAYPNPVDPNYTGLITITGLTYDADVKIMSASGALVAEGRSNGGTFVWNGCDKKGKRVASGVYMVATATKDGNKGTVCKIAIIR